MESCIVYFSQAVEPFELQIAPILDVSRRNNTRLGITGIMLYVRGSIIQVLEGDSKQVEAMYQRIETDFRHRQVERILTRPITQRLFAGFSMGYETISHAQLEEIQATFPLDTQGRQLADEPLVLRVVRTFYESNRHNQIVE
ncbi:BLUF domain-containing protein [Fibrella forsythiae]|uniref:BLUF domain-containing protein n=1 Tax=Fibrella forsythiae TaxID=2817061 RepID=A0ABS3JNH3_9BACT|nr:BLUF domain-containing protein [Fibrella forsythiae]MBO0951560.1 BLUF domain-containing protein [Fibrella forsythiae]